MPRIGVEASDVNRVAEQLAQRGQSVTVSAVRSILGTGSQSTIVRHLSAWRAASQKRKDDVAVSPEFTRAIQREIESAVEAATHKEREQAASRDADVIELGRALEVLEADIAELRGQLSVAVETREQLKGRLQAQLEYTKQCEARIEQLREQVTIADKRAAVAEAQAAAHSEIAKEVRQRLAENQNRRAPSRRSSSPPS